MRRDARNILHCGMTRPSNTTSRYLPLLDTQCTAVSAEIGCDRDAGAEALSSHDQDDVAREHLVGRRRAPTMAGRARPRARERPARRACAASRFRPALAVGDGGSRRGPLAVDRGRILSASLPGLAAPWRSDVGGSGRGAWRLSGCFLWKRPARPGGCARPSFRRERRAREVLATSASHSLQPLFRRPSSE